MGAVALPRIVLDTSVLIGAARPAADQPAAISAVSIAELHFGVLRARDDEQRAARVRRLGLIESRFPAPLPVDDLVAREWGSLMAAVAARGGDPRRRAADLAIAATARVHGATLVTASPKDFAIVDDLVAVHAV